MAQTQINALSKRPVAGPASLIPYPDLRTVLPVSSGISSFLLHAYPDAHTVSFA